MNNELMNVEIDIPAIPETWDFTEADKDFDSTIKDWRRLTGDAISTLWVFYNKLPRIDGRPKTGANARVIPSWKEWLDAKGICKDTPLRHFKSLGWIKAKPHVLHNSGENEWYTPPKFIEAAREVMGHIDTDPASSPVANETVQAETFYGSKEDGLKQEWGKKVWMNPPYSQPEITLFCDKLIEKLATGEVQEAFALVNNSTETAFGQKLLNICSSVCFPSGRVKFLDKDGNEGAPLQGQMIVYFGDENEKFCAEFAEFGVCLNG